MSHFFAATVIIAGLALSEVALGFALLALILAWAALVGLWWYYRRQDSTLTRLEENPVLRPVPEHWWESQAVFNPAAFVEGGRVHLLYRALGNDGISRIGYAHSSDGIHFERLPYPVYDRGAGFFPPKRLSYKTLTYNTDSYASGGGWGGTEDPRAVVLEDNLYVSFSVFESWQSMRLGITSLSLHDLNAHRWKWAPYILMSPEGETHKNWVLFPEKINGRFAILHALTPTIMIEYVDQLEDLHDNPIKSNNHRSGRAGKWDAFVRGAAAPPLKTPHGWLLLYHGMNPEESNVGYKVGAMLLDLADPTRVLYRSDAPILIPTQWYENDWKPGVVYASGAVIFGNDLLVYYGGGDKYIAAAKIDLTHFLHTLMQSHNATDA